MGKMKEEVYLKLCESKNDHRHPKKKNESITTQKEDKRGMKELTPSKCEEHVIKNLNDFELQMHLKQTREIFPASDE